MSITDPLSDTAIANMGGMLLEEMPMLNIADGSSSYARFCNREYGFVRDEMLRAHPWTFNKSMASLSADPVAPAFRWKLAYRLPDDCLRLHTIRAYQNGAKTPYEVFQRMVYTDATAPLNIIYGAKKTSAAEFDPLFARALGYRLGLMAAQLVTGKAAYVEKARQMYDEALQTAVHVNSQEMGSDHYVDNGWAGAPVGSLDARGRTMSG